MDEDTTQRQETPGRTISILVSGDTANEIELAALDKAREFFGTGPQLEIVPDYKAWPLPGTNLEARLGGKQYYATVAVRIVEP